MTEDPAIVEVKRRAYYVAHDPDRPHHFEEYPTCHHCDRCGRRESHPVHIRQEPE